ncbi:MAG: MBL fold metallo-hydrolase [Pirellulales bacterium]|nr:MBL fold metallo-hydrolase [Pirellulales bacterium]
MKLQFLGATQQVTGSKYLLEAGGARILVDCGMFQERAYLDRNWEPSPFPPKKLDATLVTHAHLDHCGLLPKLVDEGFRKAIHATTASADLIDILLHDSAKIQREDAEFKKKRHRREGRRGRHPVKTLFTDRDVVRTMQLFEPVQYNKPLALGERVSATFHDAGHILGSAMLALDVVENGASRRIVFSGDVGQWGKPIIRDPTVFTKADYVVMESTYGLREHDKHEDVGEQLARVVRQTVERGGNVVVPTFAIERAQELIYHFGNLLRDGAIPAVPFFLDSPMAAEATAVFRRHRDCFDVETWAKIASGDAPLEFPGLQMTETAEESKAINHLQTPAVIMATSGMCTAGRIKHHLVHNLSRPENTILFTGYQAAGTLGRQIVDGAGEVRIHGRMWPVQAKVEQIHGFSGHADGPTLLAWLRNIEQPPRAVFLTHGDVESCRALAETIGRQDGWTAHVPRYRQSFTLD